MNILFTCAGRRSYLIKYFKKEIGDEGNIIAVDMQSTAPALQFADKRYVVPNIYDKNYVDEILNICLIENVQAVFSLNDLELPILSAYFNRFENIGVQLVISSEKVIDICFDKWETIQFCKQNKIPTPLTFLDINECEKAIENGDLEFPLVLKPRWGSSSFGIETPYSAEELKLCIDLYKIKLRRSFLSEASRKGNGNSLLIQEKIEGKEFGVDILNDFSGKVKMVSVKEKLAMRAGETDKAVLISHPELVKLSTTLGNLLNHIGNLDCDFFERDGKLYLLEMNPRFGGGYPFTHTSGINYVRMIINWLKDAEEPIVSSSDNIGIPMAKCDSIVKLIN